MAVSHSAACYRGCASPVAQSTESRRLPVKASQGHPTSCAERLRIGVPDTSAFAEHRCALHAAALDRSGPSAEALRVRSPPCANPGGFEDEERRWFLNAIRHLPIKSPKRIGGFLTGLGRLPQNAPKTRPAMPAAGLVLFEAVEGFVFFLLPFLVPPSRSGLVAAYLQTFFHGVADACGPEWLREEIPAVRFISRSGASWRVHLNLYPIIRQ